MGCRTLILLFLITWGGNSLAQSYLPGLKPDRVVMNVTENPLTSVAVTWRTYASVTESFCQFQEAPPGPVDIKKCFSVKAVTKNVKYFSGIGDSFYVAQHFCRIENLKPGFSYVYRVGSNDNQSEWFQFKMPSAENKQLKFLYFGDPQVSLNDQFPRILHQAVKYSPEAVFMLFAGDIINRAGRDVEYQQLFETGGKYFPVIPLLLTPGNHDYSGRVLDSHWKYQFSFPGNGPKAFDGICYLVDYPQVRIISFDSAAGHELEDENSAEMKLQTSWLDSVLAHNPKKWTILTTHLPVYSPKSSRDNPVLRKNIQPIIEKYGVDLVLTGHDHSYARGSASDNPLTKKPPVYVVSVSGSKMYDVGDKPWIQKSGVSVQLFQEITINGNKLCFKAITADGNIFDTFVLKKRKRWNSH